jgi:hypothetical protein
VGGRVEAPNSACISTSSRSAAARPSPKQNRVTVAVAAHNERDDAESSGVNIGQQLVSSVLAASVVLSSCLDPAMALAEEMNMPSGTRAESFRVARLSVLRPLESYVPTLLQARDQLKLAGEVSSITLVACSWPCSTWDRLEQKLAVSFLFCGALQLQFDNPAEARVLLRSEPFLSLRSSVRALGDYKAITNKELVGSYSLVSNFFRY